jgi:acetyl esterase/lipase
MRTGRVVLVTWIAAALVGTSLAGAQEAAAGKAAARKKAATAFRQRFGAGADAGAGLTIDRDITYASPGGVPLKLDLYRASGDSAAKRPLIVWVHGGGWAKGSKATCRAAILARTDGYVVASIDYRLTDVAPFPAQIEDCRAAIRFLRANATAYGIDPERVGVWGGSAGGHLVALLGTSADHAAWDVGEHLDQSAGVQAVCDFFGPADLTQIPRGVRQAGPDGTLTKLFGGPVAEKGELAREASPVTHVDKADPPFLIVHGTEDTTVPLKQSEILEARLKEAGVPVELMVVEGAGHGLAGADVDQAAILERVRAFFNGHLKATKP